MKNIIRQVRREWRKIKRSFRGMGKGWMP